MFKPLTDIINYSRFHLNFLFVLYKNTQLYENMLEYKSTKLYVNMLETQRRSKSKR